MSCNPSPIPSCHTFPKLWREERTDQNGWVKKATKKKKKNSPRFCWRKTLTHYLHSASLARLIHLFLLTPLFPHSLYPPPLTPGLLFCRSSSFSFHLPASESLMPAMSWSVRMWAAFRMIIPAHCVRLISHSLPHTSCRRPTLNIVFHQIVRMWLRVMENGRNLEMLTSTSQTTGSIPSVVICLVKITLLKSSVFFSLLACFSVNAP